MAWWMLAPALAFPARVAAVTAPPAAANHAELSCAASSSPGFALLAPTELALRQACKALREELDRYLEKLPARLRPEWLKAFRAARAAENLLYARVREERDALESKVFGDIASRLGLERIDDLYLHTDLTDRDGLPAQRSFVIERVTDFIRRGQDFSLRGELGGSARAYFDFTRINRQNAYSLDSMAEVDARKLVAVLAEYDAPSKVAEAVRARFDDTASPLYARASLEEAAKAEFVFAMLDALRRGDIGLAQYERLAAAVKADRGHGEVDFSYADPAASIKGRWVPLAFRTTSKLLWAAHELRVGAPPLIGKAPAVQLPAFTLRAPAEDGLPALDVLYVPGHPSGALRLLPAGQSASSLILEGIDGDASSRGILAWLTSRMTPEDFRQLLAEFARAKPPKKPVEWPGGKVKRALQEKAAAEPNPLTRWLADALKGWLDPGPGTPRLSLDQQAPARPPRRFVDALVSSQLNRARRTMTPPFVSKDDADMARLERIALDVLEESLSVVMLPFPARGLESVQLLGFIGMLTQRSAGYLMQPGVGAADTAELVTDFVDLSFGMLSSAVVPRLGQQRLRRMTPVVYRPPGGKRGLWFEFDTRRHALSAPPEGAAKGTDGVFVRGEERFVPLETADGPRVLPVLKDGADYRLKTDGGAPGPLVRRLGDRWRLSHREAVTTPSSLLGLLLEDYTSDATVLARARTVMQRFGLSERELPALAGKDRLPGPEQLVLGAVGHAFLETQLARLRAPEGTPWTRREEALLAPAMAEQIARPLVVHGDDGTVELAVLPDGSDAGPGGVPANALHVRRIGARYALGRPGATGAPRQYATLFAAVEAGSRPASDHRVRSAAEWEAGFRAKLADAIGGRSMRAQLERMYRLWIDPLAVPARQREDFKAVSRLRHALMDPQHAPSALEERRLLEGVRDLMATGRRVSVEVRERASGRLLASFDDETPAPRAIVIEADLAADGSRSAYYRRDASGRMVAASAGEGLAPLVDALLNAGNGDVRHALFLGERDGARFVERLVARIVANEDALLPPGLAHLVRGDEATLALAAKQHADTWLDGARKFARLRDLAGRTQVVEVSLAAADGLHELLAPPGRGARGTGRFVFQRDGKWYPTPGLRGGFDPVDSPGRPEAAAAIRHHLPLGAAPDDAAMQRILDSIPQLVLRDVAEHLDNVRILPDTTLELQLRQPEGVWAYQTRMNRHGLPIPYLRSTGPAPARPPTPVSHYLRLAPANEIARSPTPPAMLRQRRSLLASGAPISRFIALGVRGTHTQALVNARRLRGMLAEDDRMAVVAAVDGHAFTLVLPIDARTVHQREWASIGELPAGSRIIDSLYGVATTPAEYPARIRAVARRWSVLGESIDVTAPDGSVLRATAKDFTDHVLTAPVRISLWNPLHDPISEAAYLEYIRYRYEHQVQRSRAGLDWLTTEEARRDYTAYFAPPFGLPVAQGAEAGAAAVGLDRDALRAEVVALGQQAGPVETASPAASATTVRTHEEAVPEFNHWLEEFNRWLDNLGAPQAEPAEAAWDFDLDLLETEPAERG
jgi:hypothetical protein